VPQPFFHGFHPVSEFPSHQLPDFGYRPYPVELPPRKPTHLIQSNPVCRHFVEKPIHQSSGPNGFRLRPNDNHLAIRLLPSCQVPRSQLQ